MRNSKIQKLAILLLALSPYLIDGANAAEVAPPGAAKNPQVAMLIKKGIGKAKESDFHQAISCFNEALSLDPQSYDGFVNRGWTFRQMGDLEKAVADYTSAIKVNPDKAQVYLNRGWCQKKLGKFDEALADFNKAIEVDPKYVNAYRNRGSLKLKIGDYAGAITDFNQLLALDPDAKAEVAKYIPPELLASSTNLDPKATSKIGQTIADAIKGSSLEITDSDLAKLNNRAAQAIKAGDFGAAIGMLEEIARKKPDYKFAKDNLTTAYNNQGLKLAQESPEQSAAQFRKALFYSPEQGATRNNLNAMLKAAGSDPQSESARIGIGDQLKEQGDYTGAFVEYMEALRLNNGSKARQKVAEVCALIKGSKEAGAPGAMNIAAIAGSSTTESEAPVPTEGASTTTFDQGDSTASSIEVPATEFSASGTAAHETKSEEPLPEGVQATALALSQPKKIGHDIETMKLKWQNHVTHGDELFDQGNYVDAEAEYKESLIVAKKELGDNSNELIDSLERLSRIFLVQRRPVEALSLLEQAYSLRKDASGETDKVSLDRLGSKVLKLRHMLYPGAEDKEKAEENEEPEFVAKDNELEELDRAFGEEKGGATAGRGRKHFPTLLKLPKRKKSEIESAMERVETADRPASYTEKPSWDDWTR